MKKIILLTIFILTFCFVAFAQNNEIFVCRNYPHENPSKKDLFLTLDNFYNEVSADANVEGFIIIEFKQKNRQKKVAFLRLFNQWFNYRKADRTRVTLIISKTWSNQTTVFFDLQYKFDDYTEINNTVIKGENLRQAINTIFKN